MSDPAKKWLLWGSLVPLPIWIGGTIFFSIYLDTGTNKVLVSISEVMIYVSFILTVLSGLNLTVFFSIRFHKRKWLNQIGRFSLFLLPLFSTFIYFLADNSEILDSGLAIIPIIIIILLTLFVLIYIFILREPVELTGVLVLLFFIVICVVLQRFRISFSAIADLFLPGFIILTATGLYMFGLYCLFIIEKNSYLKTISFIACTLTAFGSFLFFLKIQGDKVDVLELIYFVPAFLMTLIVLLSLPISGYINWSTRHKRILKKIVISCFFFLLIFSFRFIYPDFFKLMILRSETVEIEFFMEDYELPNKNGLEPE
jgi:hypothetical protein